MHLYHLHTNILASSASTHCIKRNDVVYLKLVIDILHIEEVCVCSPETCIVHLGRDCRPARLLFFSLSYQVYYCKLTVVKMHSLASSIGAALAGKDHSKDPSKGECSKRG